MRDTLLFYVLFESVPIPICCAELSIFYSLGSSFSSARVLCSKPPTGGPHESSFLSWEAAFPLVRVKALERSPSDHNPLLVDSGDVTPDL